MLFNAHHYTVVTGLGRGSRMLNAFDNALQNAGVGNFNLLKVSSILPPGCEKAKTIDVAPGSVLPIAYSSISSMEKGREITAAIGVGIPMDSNSVGVIMEFADYTTSSNAEGIVKQMIEEAMANRNTSIKRIIVKSCSSIVDSWNCVFAGIALW